MGRVVNRIGEQSSRGLGIEFTEVDPIDKNRLQACLTELQQRRNYRLFLAVNAP